MKHYGLLTLKHLFALFSIVGGHWLNGQYKKGIFFSLLLLALAWIGAKGTLDLFGYYIRYIITQDNIQIFYTDHPLLFMIFPLVALAIIVATLLSYYHYWKDLRSAPPKMPSLTFRCIYALLLTFAMLAVPISSGVGIFTTLEHYHMFNGSVLVSSLKSDWSRSLKFAENKLEASQHHLEPGDGKIHGTLMYQQKPVSNAGLYIRWQGVEESSWVRTDAMGAFKISLPLGRWHIQMISVSGEKKDADLAAGWLSSVGSQPIDAELGLQIDVKKDHIAELNLQFSDPIKLLFPAPAKFEQPISISDGQIRWQEVEGAQSYKVEIHRFNGPVGKAKLGGYNSMSEVASRVTMNHDFIALNAFHHVHNPQKKNEYTVTVIARDVYGQVISETSSRAREEHSFLV